MSNRPLVSIIAPCYNGALYLRPFLESVVAQSYENIELIFIDDGSTDTSKDIVVEYIPRFEERGSVLLYSFQDNKGAAAAINKGLASFHGDYLMWTDADDILCVDNVEEKVNYLENHPEFDFVICEAELVDYLNPEITLKRIKREKPEGEDSFFEDYLEERNIVYGSGEILVRREAFLRAIPERKITESRQGQNFQLMLPLTYCLKCGYLEKPLYKIVKHPDSHSRMDRAYGDYIKRQTDFIELIISTINKIPMMSLEEKVSWGNTARIRFTKRKLIAAYSNHRLKDVHMFLEELSCLGARLERAEKKAMLRKFVLSFLPESIRNAAVEIRNNTRRRTH